MIEDFKKRTDFIDIGNKDYICYIHDHCISAYVTSKDTEVIRKFIMKHAPTSGIRFKNTDSNIDFFISIFSDRIYRGIVVRNTDKLYVYIIDDMKDDLLVFDGRFIILQDIVQYFINKRKGVGKLWNKL